MVDRGVGRPRRIVRPATVAPRPGDAPNGIPASRSATDPDLPPATDPTEPTEPTEPAEPPNPAEVAEPTEPAEVAEPAEPAKPAEPAVADSAEPEPELDPGPDPAPEPPAGVPESPPAAEITAEAPTDEAEPAPTPRPQRRSAFQELPYGFPTEALLDDHVAAADELRADLDRLRRQLDVPPPPLPPARRRSRTRLLGALVVVGTLAAIATAVLVPWSDIDLDGNAAPPRSVTRNVGQDRPDAVPVPAPRSAPAGSLPATGPGVSEPGTMMVVTVAANGSLDVTEQAVLGPRELREINLRLPSMASLGGQVAELTPTVNELRVAVNGTPVTATPTADGPGWVVASSGGERARTVQLSYRIEDAIVRTQPSSDGRALGVSLPLLGQALRDQGLPLIVRTEGPGVGGVSCPSAPPAQMLCGLEVEGGWLATIPPEAASPTLLLQLNLT